MENAILKNNFNFLKKIEKMIIEELDIYRKFQLMDFYAVFAANNPSGSLHNPFLEYHLMDISERILTSASNNKLDKSLIIMTEAYKYGGHTRIVEHTINNSDDNKFDLLFTRNNFEVPNSLLKICQNKKCNILFLSHEAILLKAKQLREVASGYNNIIMHIHPEDYLPILSFGYSKWNIPIFLYNHAEHRFWFGISVVDVVMDLSSRARDNSIKYRKIAKSEILDIPVIDTEIDQNKNQLMREKLNIDKSAVVFLSGGSPYKYIPTDKLDFRNVVDLILSNIPNSFFVIIGISPNSYKWKKLKNKFTNRLILIELLEHEKYLEYLNIANIYIDSIPTGGFTVLLENAIRKTPIVFLKTPLSYPDSIVMEAVDYDMILDKIKIIINNNFIQNINLENHKIHNFILKHENIISSNRKHERNLNIMQVVDFDESSIIRYILKSVYKDKVEISLQKFSNLPFCYKLKVSLLILTELKKPVIFLKIFTRRIKKLLKKITK